MRFKPTQPLRHAALVSLLAVTVSGCALLKGADAPRETYELTAPAAVGNTGGTRAQVLVKAPSALKSIDSDRIVVRPSPGVITYLAGAQWSDTLPRMVQSKLIATFENAEATGATAQPGDGLVIDYQLITEIRHFGIDGQAGSARIEMSVKLLSDKSGRVLDTRIFTATAPAPANLTSDAYVAALDRAFNEVARSVLSWVVSRV